MANEGLSMTKIKEILRLHASNSTLSLREIAASCGIAHSAVAGYIRRAKQYNVAWKEAQHLSDQELSQRLHLERSSTLHSEKVMPDWHYIHQERKKPHVTMRLLWEEYTEEHKETGYQYSWFHDLYRAWRKKLNISMRQVHQAGEKVFVDYCSGLSIVDKATGTVFPTQIFIGVWGASNYTYAEATLSQKQHDWIMAHVRMFEYSGCVPRVLVPDNLKSGVSKACRYEPDINRTYAELARHYRCSVVPARPYKPKDKAKAETGVLIAQRWIRASLRNRVFYTLAELNREIRTLLEKLNTRQMQKLKCSRQDLFARTDKPFALSLPATRYEYARWHKARVNIDYHIEVDGHYYSVPYQLRHERVDIRITNNIIEVFWKNTRQAAHPHSHIKHHHTTKSEHMPPAHQKYLAWTPSRIITWAGTIGPATQAVAESILNARRYPEQAYRSCLGILRLGKQFSPERLECACKRAIYYRTFSYKSVKLILLNGFDALPSGAPEKEVPASAIHKNIRGADYYKGGDTIQ